MATWEFLIRTTGDEDQYYYWLLVDEDGLEVSQSAETFDFLSDCKDHIERVKEAVADAALAGEVVS